jgi:NTP pyrophosphatase (non-canonical NTP hydrolase)
MGYEEMARVTDISILFAWLVEEVGELGRTMVRKRDPSKLNSELADVWNCLHAIAIKHDITPEQLAKIADNKGKNYKERK